MSERRRSLLVLLVVLGLIAGSVYAVSTRDTKLGLDLQGGVQLIYEGQPTAQQPTVTQEALQRSLDIMRDRVDAFGVAEPELLLAGENQIEVNLPGEEDAERAAAQVGSTAQLFFYDWEANILDEDCRTDPDENANGEAGGHRLPQRGRAGLQVRPAGRRQQQLRRRAALLRVRQDVQAAAQQRPAVRLARGRARGPRRRGARQRRGARGARGHPRRARREAEPRRSGPRPLLGDPGQPGALRHRHQEPGAELRPAHERADRHVRLHGPGPRRVPADHRRHRPARRSTTRCRATTRPTARSTSRSCSTTSSSRRR